MLRVQDPKCGFDYLLFQTTNLGSIRIFTVITDIQTDSFLIIVAATELLQGNIYKMSEKIF